MPPTPSSQDTTVPDVDVPPSAPVTPTIPALVRVVRGGVMESRHRVHVAVVDAAGTLVAGAGDPRLGTFLRSAAKPFQALPLVEDGAADALGLTGRELALCCGSHSGEPAHIEGVRQILARAGEDETALACGPHRPKRRSEADALVVAGAEAGPVHNNCSGKHAGMVALAVHHGWPVEGYLEPGHPVQRRMLAEVARWTGLEEDAVRTGTDGCGVVCFATPLRAMARAFARFAEAAARGDEGPARIEEAMTSHPFMVAGTDRLCTALMEAAGDRVAAKTGAEGVYGALVRSGPRRGLGIAIKAEDGASRASEPALLRTLELLGVLDEEELSGPLASFRRPRTRNTLGDEVGRVEADFDLEGLR